VGGEVLRVPIFQVSPETEEPRGLLADRPRVAELSSRSVPIDEAKKREILGLASQPGALETGFVVLGEHGAAGGDAMEEAATDTFAPLSSIVLTVQHPFVEEEGALRFHEPGGVLSDLDEARMSKSSILYLKLKLQADKIYLADCTLRTDEGTIFSVWPGFGADAVNRQDFDKPKGESHLLFVLQSSSTGWIGAALSGRPSWANFWEGVGAGTFDYSFKSCDVTAVQ
jgi:hypothetical protein